MTEDIVIISSHHATNLKDFSLTALDSILTLKSKKKKMVRKTSLWVEML